MLEVGRVGARAVDAVPHEALLQRPEPGHAVLDFLAVLLHLERDAVGVVGDDPRPAVGEARAGDLAEGFGLDDVEDDEEVVALGVGFQAEDVSLAWVLGWAGLDGVDSGRVALALCLCDV